MNDRGFTLVELLVAVVVMATLMCISFRLMHAGDDASARSLTLTRLQRLQNCLSGYNAAFGHYPAVPLHASRDFRLKANNYGIQTETRDSAVRWRNVRAALLAQPVAAEFPFDREDAFVAGDVAVDSALDVKWAKAAKKTGEPVAVAVLTKGYGAFSPSLVSSSETSADWREVQAFRYGLLSFLLPRSQFMLAGEASAYDLEQWTAFNELGEYYDPETGKALAADWTALANGLRDKSSQTARSALASVSQSACARWLPNLAGQVRGGGTYYGVDTSDGKAFREREHGLRDAEASDILVHAPGGPSAPNASSQYVLDGMTVLDGWENEFYYYSPAPHRTCRVWSAGADGKSFPPWVDPQAAAADAQLKEALGWTRDDLVAQLQ